MSSDPIIDVERLLQPISAEQPTGVELSVSDPEGPFMRIKDAFDEARKLIKEEQDKELSGGVDSFNQPWRTIPTPDWQTVIDLASATLEKDSKDFRVAAWLTEALLRTHFIFGLRDGMQLCLGLCERYWADIHPPANEEDGHGVTVGAFAGLVTDATYQAILLTPIAIGTKPSERVERCFSALDHLHAKELEQTSNQDERERLMKLGYVEMSEFQSIAALTPPELHAKNLATSDTCIATINTLGEFFRENCQDDEYDEATAPAVSGFREQLESLRRLVQELSGDNQGPADEEDGQSADAASDIAPGGSAAPQGMTREQAFQTVEKVAQFFERTEPHTPVSFALRQVVRWGRMPLPALLAELIDDNSIMEALRRQIGLPPDDNANE